MAQLMLQVLSVFMSVICMWQYIVAKHLKCTGLISVVRISTEDIYFVSDGVPDLPQKGRPLPDVGCWTWQIFGYHCASQQTHSSCCALAYTAVKCCLHMMVPPGEYQ